MNISLILFPICYPSFSTVDRVLLILPFHVSNFAFSSNLQIVGDITKESTLAPEYFKGVRKVINAASVVIGPKEGDTPDRAKYSQV